MTDEEYMRKMHGSHVPSVEKQEADWMLSMDERLKRANENITTVMALMHQLAGRCGYELDAKEGEDGSMDARWVRKDVVKTRNSGIVIL